MRVGEKYRFLVFSSYSRYLWMSGLYSPLILSSTDASGSSMPVKSVKVCNWSFVLPRLNTLLRNACPTAGSSCPCCFTPNCLMTDWSKRKTPSPVRCHRKMLVAEAEDGAELYKDG